MHDQLVHLLFMAERKNITVRVVRSTMVQHQGLNGAFVLLDTVVANVMFENPDHVAVYRSTVDELDRIALNEEWSKQFIACQAAEFGR